MDIGIKNIGLEINFNVKIKKSSERVKFYRKLYGYKSYSNHGKYVYLKEGLLSNIPYLKPTNSFIIVSKEDSKKIENFLYKKDVRYKKIKVILEKEDAEKINKSL